MARSWDNAGNDEGPPDYEYIQIDQTPPVVTETATPTTIERVHPGVMAHVDYSGTAEDELSGIPWGTTSTVLIDEYGELDQDLGSSLTGYVNVEAWVRGNDRDGRTYTIRLTTQDRAGNTASADAIVTVIK